MEAKRKTLTQLSVPICLETLFYMLSGMVDTLMLSSVSDQAVGAVGTANTYIGVFIIMFGVISSGMIAVMSQNIGAGRPGIAYQARQLGLIFNALIGIIMSIILAAFSGGMLRIVSIAPALLEPAEIYLRIVGGTCFLNALIPIFSSYLRVFGYTKHPYHDYYVWRDGEEDVYPNDMNSVFGGPAWEWVPELGQYYFHQFSVKQPDLNWENPKVRRELYDMILWWMEKGAGGFRLDVIDQIAKEPDLKITNNGPKLHEFLRELSRETFQKGDMITVGEAWGATPEIAKKYSNPDGSEFSMVFQFEHIMLDQEEGKEKWDTIPLNLVKLKKCLAKWQNTLYQVGWNSLFMNNHDLPRIVSRWGNDGKYRKESAKMLATMLHGMQGTPYIYQGEELGMTNVQFDSIEEYEDIETLNMYKERLKKGYQPEEILHSIYARSRDNARTPMQWSSEKNGGFTTGEPWFAVNPNYIRINAKEALEDENSVFYYYQKLIQLRKENPVFVDGKFELLLPEDERIFAYTRTDEHTKMLVCTNFTDEEVSCPLLDEWKAGEVWIRNYEDGREGNILRPYEAVIIGTAGNVVKAG